MDKSIQKAKYIKQQLDFFTLQAMSLTDLYQGNSLYASDIKRWLIQYVGNGNENDQKVIRFEENERLLQPSKTSELFEKAFSRNKKALRAKDKYIALTVKNKNQNIDKFQQNYDHERFIEEEVYYSWCHSPNDFVAIDYPEEGGDPYPFIISIDQVESFEYSERGKLQRLVFKTEKGIHTFTEKERTFQSEEDNQLNYSYPHKLGYTPAIQISSLKIEHNVYGNVFTPILGLMKQIWFWSISAHYAETYMAFPVTWFLDDDVSEYESFSEFAINTGFPDVAELPSSERLDINSKYIAYLDALKNRDGHVGAGEVFKVALGEDERFQIPVGRVEPSVEGLKYLDEKQKARESQFLTATKGRGGEPENNQAINEKQVDQGYQSEQEILSTIASQMQRVHRFLVKCLTDEIYEMGQIQVSINYGGDFFKLTLDQAWENFRKAKENGMFGLLQEMAKDIIDIQFKHDPVRRRREVIKNMLCDYYLADNKEITEWASAGLVTREQWTSKVNLPSLIYELEIEIGQPIESYKDDQSVGEIIPELKTRFNQIVNR